MGERNKLNKSAILTMFGSKAGQALINFLDPCCEDYGVICEAINKCVGSGGISLPLSRVGYGTGTGITSDPEFTRTVTSTEITNDYSHLDNNSSPAFAGGGKFSGSYLTNNSGDFLLLSGINTDDGTKQNSGFNGGFAGDGGIFFAGYDHIGMSFTPIGSSRKWNFRLDDVNGWGFTSITNVHTLFASGANWDGITTNSIFSIYNDGEWQFQMYPNTRDDSGNTIPINFFYSDNQGNLKSAPLTSIFNTLQVDTRVNWLTNANNNTLPYSTNILISDATGSYGIILKTNPYGNGFETTGVGIFQNADFQGIGDYSDVVNITSQVAGNLQGIWNLANQGSYVQGDMVIWNNIHYQLTSIGDISTNTPDVNTDAYTVITRGTLSDKYGYITVLDVVTYDIISDIIFYREDKIRNNKIDYNTFNNFDWGNNNTKDIIIDCLNSNINLLNNRGSITGNITGKNSYISIAQNTGNVYFSLNRTNNYLQLNTNTGYADIHIAGYSSGMDADNNSGTIVVYIYDESEMSASNNSGIIKARYYDGSYVQHSSNAGNIIDGYFAYGFNGTIVLNSGITHNKCVYNNSLQSFIWDSAVNYDKKVITNLGSTFDKTIDITGVTTLNISCNYCGIINLVGSTTEGIDTIINYPTIVSFRVNFTPILAFTVTGTPAGLMVNGGIALSSIAFVGNGSYGDFITFENAQVNGVGCAKQIAGGFNII